MRTIGLATACAVMIAVISAHTGQAVIIQGGGFQQANLTPFIQHIVPPNVIQAFPVSGPGG